MRRFRNKPADSLDLLLDTMCNTFGGIILIAILVALIARDNPVSPLSAGLKASGEMQERRLAIAEADLAAARALRDSLAVPADPRLAEALAQKRGLESTLATLQNESAALTAKTSAQAADQAKDPGQQGRAMIQEQRRFAEEAVELQNAIRAQDQNSARLKARLAELGARISHEREARVVKLRFPKERAQTKKSFPVICRYGRIYPLFDENRDRNEKTIQWKKIDEDASASFPISGAGWEVSPAGREIQQFIARFPGEDSYVAFYVYPDSFTAFRELRDLAAGRGLDFGIDLLSPDYELIWGNKGSTPPPL